MKGIISEKILIVKEIEAFGHKRKVASGDEESSKVLGKTGRQ